MSLNTQDVVDRLHAAGLDRVRRLLVHSSLHSIGHVEGGAKTLVDALLEVLGNEGTLMVPTFNYTLGGEDLFDPDVVASQCGTVTEVVCQWPGAIRSIHPNYSVATVGKDAERLTREHWKAEAVGVGSPIDRIARNDGRILLLGVKHDSDSTMHVGEAYAPAPYRGVRFDPTWPLQAKVRTPSGDLVELSLEDEPGCSTGFGVIEAPLRDKGLIQDFKIGHAKCQLIRGMDVIATTVEILKQRTDALLCANPRCYFCTQARKMEQV